jgi:hypothetical protein
MFANLKEYKYWYTNKFYVVVLYFPFSSNGSDHLHFCDWLDGIEKTVLKSVKEPVELENSGKTLN